MSHISRELSSRSLKIPVSARALDYLFEIDGIIAEEAKRTGCGHCGGKSLHRADYYRADWGLPSVPGGVRPRPGFACGRCRRRTTPPSVRYAGRRFYVAAVFLPFSLFLPGSLDRLRTEAGLSIAPCAATRRRWRRWWRDGFPRTLRWRDLAARIAEHAGEAPPVRLLKLSRRGDWTRLPAFGILQLLKRFRPFGRRRIRKPGINRGFAHRDALSQILKEVH